LIKIKRWIKKLLKKWSNNDTLTIKLLSGGDYLINKQYFPDLKMISSPSKRYEVFTEIFSDMNWK